MSRTMEMSLLLQRNQDLVRSYELSLERRIANAGSNLVCNDEALQRQVEGMLESGDARDMHCLGLDPLGVMEESLKSTLVPPCRGGRGGLKGLAKAFEVLEQAALNLYLGPWREEYKAVKMYSGLFTHYIKPALSMPQITKLFGLLGYQPCSGRQEQLRRQSPGAARALPGDLLRLSCAFYLARCECRLLLGALGSHGGEVDWELALVTDRLRGRGLQAALENIKKTLQAKRPLKEEASGLSSADSELELDLYTAEDVRSGQTEAAVPDEVQGPRSLSWTMANHGGRSPTAVHTNGLKSPSTSSPPPSSFGNSKHAEPYCVSTLHYQLSNNTPPLRSSSSAARSAPATAAAAAKQAASPYEAPRRLGLDKADCQSRSPTGQVLGSSCHMEASSPSSPLSGAELVCVCVQSGVPYLNHCLDCNALHSSTCALLQDCYAGGHGVLPPDDTAVVKDEARRPSPQRAPRLRERSISPASFKEEGEAAASSALLGSISTTPQPIPYHECCDPAHPDPRLTCYTCKVFHSASCRDGAACQENHEVLSLKVCPCGRKCFRIPLVLCRYCGVEYCKSCWYKTPLTCACGQTFDQSSSV